MSCPSGPLARHLRMSGTFGPKPRRPDMRSIVRKSLLNAFLLGAASTAAFAGAQSGCSSTGGAGPEGSEGENGSSSVPSEDGTGSVGMQLTLPGGAQLTAVNWTITGPGGASTAVQNGTVNVGNSQSVSFLVGRIPAGAGYTITLTATSTDGSTTCLGSATFSITARLTTSVSVALQCTTAAAEAGSALINGTTYACAVWNSLAA